MDSICPALTRAAASIIIQSVAIPADALTRLMGRGVGIKGYDDGGVIDPQQAQQMLTLSPQQLQNSFMQQYGGWQGGMKKGGVPTSYEILDQISKQNPPKGESAGIPARYAKGGVTTAAAPTATPQFTPDQLSTLQNMWMAQFGNQVPVGPLAGGAGWYSNAPNPDTGPQQGTLNPTTIGTSNLANLPAAAGWLFQGLPASSTIPKLTATTPPMRRGGVAVDENDNPASYQPTRGGMKGIEAMAPDAKFQGGGVSDKRPETGSYSDNPKVITELEHVAPYYYATPSTAAADNRVNLNDLMNLGLLPRATTPETFRFQGGGVTYGGMMFDPTQMSFSQQQQQPQSKTQASPVAGEPSGPAPKQAAKYEFGPADYWYEQNFPQIMQALMAQQTPTLQQGQGPPPNVGGAKDGGVIPKEFMQYLAAGGLVKKDFTPHDHLMFALGGMYALSPKQAAKRLKNSANLLPP